MQLPYIHAAQLINIFIKQPEMQRFLFQAATIAGGTGFDGTKFIQTPFVIVATVLLFFQHLNDTIKMNLVGLLITIAVSNIYRDYLEIGRASCRERVCKYV